MAKVLLVDTNFSSLPIYHALVALGHDVHVVGNNPVDCLAKISPNYWEVDYSDLATISALIDREKYTFLVPGCTDRSYLSCVAAGNGRFPGIDHADAYEAVFNKATFLRHAKRLGLSTPCRIAMDGLPAHYPVIVKPVDAFSGKGITVLRRADQTDFDAAVANARAASASGEVIIEEYVEGQLYSHSAFIRNGRVLVDFLVREDCTANPFVVDTSCVADLPTAEVDKLRHYAEQIAGDLNLVDGLLHTQFIRGDAGVYLIETTRRCPGDLYSQLIELTTGFPYARAYVMPFLGQSPNTRHAVPHRNPIMRHTVTLKEAQSFAYLRFKAALQIERWIPLSLTGDQLKPSPRGRIGVLFCRGTDARDLDQIYQAALRRDLYEVCS